MSTTCPQDHDAHPARLEIVHTSDMIEGMATTRTPNVKRLISQALELPPEERALLIRTLLGDDGLRGASEAAGDLGVLQVNLRPVPGLPPPVQTLRCGSVWLTDEIKVLAMRRRQERRVA